MKTFRFRDFTIYKEARIFRTSVQRQLCEFPVTEKYRLVDQIHRSCLSILLNIAEGSAKKSDKDFARFLEIAIGSLNEIIAAFDAASDNGLVSAQQITEIEIHAEKLAKQIGSLLKKLRNPQDGQMLTANSQ
ncbi:MAG: four helix bundle protein [Patescibacteria group bacterium]